MKTIIIVFLLIAVMCGSVFAECAPVEFGGAAFDGFKETLNERFPFSVITEVVTFLDDLTRIEVKSPSDITMSFVGVDVPVFGFLENSVFDVVMTGIRYLMLAMIAFGIVKHLMEYVL